MRITRPMLIASLATALAAGLAVVAHAQPVAVHAAITYVIQAPPAPSPSTIAVLIAGLLRLGVPLAAAWLMTEWNKGIGWINNLGAIGVTGAGLVWGYLAAFITAHVPWFPLPSDISQVSVQNFATFLSGLITLITHVQATAPARAAARRARGLKH